MSRRSNEYWEQEEMMNDLIFNLEVMDSEEFEELYDKLDADHQIQVDIAVREFANNAIGDEHWDSDD